PRSAHVTNSATSWQYARRVCSLSAESEAPNPSTSHVTSLHGTRRRAVARGAPYGCARWTRTSGVARDLTPGCVRVEAGLPRQTEYALADDVAHDLRRSTGDRRCLRREEGDDRVVALDVAVAPHFVPRREHAVRAEQVHDEVHDALAELGVTEREQ